VREYSTREVAEIAGLPAAQVRRWARAGLVTPHKDGRGCWRYSFQDLALLRTARKLLDAPLTLNRVTRTLRLLRAQLPPGRPLSAVRILVNGSRVVVKDRLASWEPASRQGTLDFDPKALSSQIAPKFAPRRKSERRPASSHSAADLYQSALDLELAGRADEAQQTYRDALQRDPTLVSARINLGRLLHNANRTAEAEALYRAALEQDPGNVLATFNLGVALEDQGLTDAAIDAYRRTLAIDEAYADAHFNLSRLLETAGDKRAALRHLIRFKRLIHQDV
jgi:tetratricopeptide (TPR) repeat protein